MSETIPPHILQALLFDDGDQPEDHAPSGAEGSTIVEDVAANNDGQVTRVQWREGAEPINPKTSIVTFFCLEEAKAMAVIDPFYRTFARLGGVLILPLTDSGSGSDSYLYRIVSHEVHRGDPSPIQQRKGLERVRRHMEARGMHLIHVSSFACLRRIEDQRLVNLCTFAFRKFPSPEGKRFRLAISSQSWERPTVRELRHHAKSLLSNRRGAECRNATAEDIVNCPFD
jgi:hypothetical protein